jgi:hypothetical protein
MNKKTYYGFVETDGGMTYRMENEPTLDEMQEWVGGLIEYAPVRPGAKFQYHVDKETMVWGETLEVIVNEEGLLLNLESNEIASIMACGMLEDATGWQTLVGRAIVKYTIDEDDEPINPIENAFQFMQRCAELANDPSIAVSQEVLEALIREKNRDKLREMFD